MRKSILILFLVLGAAPLTCDSGKAVYVLNPSELIAAEDAKDKQPAMPTPAPAPIKNEEMPPEETAPKIVAPSYESSIIRIFYSFIGLIALVIISFWLFRRLANPKMKSSGSHKAIAILERKALSPKTMLYLVEVDGEKIFLTESHLEIRMLPSQLGNQSEMPDSSG